MQIILNLTEKVFGKLRVYMKPLIFMKLAAKHIPRPSDNKEFKESRSNLTNIYIPKLRIWSLKIRNLNLILKFNVDDTFNNIGQFVCFLF